MSTPMFSVGDRVRVGGKVATVKEVLGSQLNLEGVGWRSSFSVKPALIERAPEAPPLEEPPERSPFLKEPPVGPLAMALAEAALQRGSAAELETAISDLRTIQGILNKRGDVGMALGVGRGASLLEQFLLS